MSTSQQKEERFTLFKRYLQRKGFKVIPTTYKDGRLLMRISLSTRVPSEYAANGYYIYNEIASAYFADGYYTLTVSENGYSSGTIHLQQPLDKLRLEHVITSINRLRKNEHVI